MPSNGNSHALSSSADNGSDAHPEWAVGAAEHTDFDDRIRRRAYELYLQRGDTPGDAQADWLTAERECVAAATRDRAAVVTNRALAQLGVDLRA